MPPQRPRLHPLSAYSRTEIWARLQHFFESEPDLPEPLLESSANDPEDIVICARLIEAFGLGRAYERSNIHPEKQPNEGVWEEMKAAHSEAYHLLESKNAAGLADYLRNGLRTTLCSALGSGPATFETMSGADWRDPVLQLVDSVASLAEAVGALPCENPILGPYGQNIHLGIPELTEAIESKLRFPINRPKVMGIYGIGHDGGVIDVRVPDDAYCAHRIRLISNDISRTRFIEIGGGFGGMALFALRAGVTNWVIVDLPIINVVQGYFLMKCLGGNAVRLFGEHNETAAVEVLPYWEFFDRDRHYSVVFSRWALQEIARDRVDEYLAEIETRGADLLSINHEAGAPNYLNLHHVISKRGKLRCRLRHPYWIRKGYVEELFKR